MKLKQLEQGIEEYFARCEENGDFPDLAGMKLSLGLSDSDAERLCTVGRQAAGCARAFERARQRRESWLARRAAGPASPRGCLSLLNRPENGGYDTQESGTVKVVIDLEALGGIESAK